MGSWGEMMIAKKLEVKNGKLGGNDDLSMLLEGIPSILDIVDDEDAQAKTLLDAPAHKKRKQSKYAMEEVESQKESANMDGLSSLVDAGSEEHDNVEELSISKDTKKKKRKTKSEEYLEMEEMQEGAILASKASKSQKKLKRKLKVKEGESCRDDDGTNKVFEGTPGLSTLDNVESRDDNSAEQEQATETTISISSGISEPVKNNHVTDMAVHKVPASVSEMGGKKYVASHLRSHMQNESEENAQMRKRVC